MQTAPDITGPGCVLGCHIPAAQLTGKVVPGILGKLRTWEEFVKPGRNLQLNRSAPLLQSTLSSSPFQDVLANSCLPGECTRTSQLLTSEDSDTQVAGPSYPATPLLLKPPLVFAHPHITSLENSWASWTHGNPGCHCWASAPNSLSRPPQVHRAVL